MTGDATTSSEPTELNFGITNVKAFIAIILDLDELKYDQWFELFTIHCKTFGVYGHLTGTMKSSGPTNDNWEKRDNLVKQWFYETISKALVKLVLKKDLKACDIWKNLKDVLHDIKDARAMQLDTKLLASIIHHRGLFPTFNTARPMLLVEESIESRHYPSLSQLIILTIGPYCNLESPRFIAKRSVMLKLVDSRGILPVICWIEHGEKLRDDVQKVQQALEVTDKAAKSYYVDADKQKSSNSNLPEQYTLIY
nr:hypothetical protein [Tanacetum cinerariifolium]